MVKSSAKARALRLDSVFHALSDTTRRSILRHVATGEKTVGQIAAPYPVSLAAVSKHLKVLEGAKLIHREKKGSFQMVRINAAPMREAEQWLAYYEKFWSEGLDALQNLLEREESR
ncbi:MAG TPA: metalloregulator ArsR/SmtB family transcription factor [Bryobacteraceae bacterium]|jgi:DNA-binding transcriptional ArsR family regulator|nr:metalloregulator ArsR/SmtB family transcription factor [Bryobacteraceae bacterium]